ncbi:MAG: hypothetical protein ACI8RZ_000786 [Myxococcota bacterium]|jgi:uncharacterized protein involved in response to NO
MPTVSIEKLWSEPYRLLFPITALTGAAGCIGWLSALSGHGPTITPSQHGLLMLVGVIGAAVIGFLTTAYPRQNQGAVLGARGALLVTTTQVAVIGLLVGGWWTPVLQSTGLALGVLLWAGLSIWSLTIAVPSLRRKPDPTTAGVPAVLLVGAVGIGLCGWWPMIGLSVLLLGALMPLAILLLDRLVPFFSRRIPGYSGGRRAGLLAGLAVGTLLRLLAGEADWSAGASLGLAAILLRQWWGWQPTKGARVPMLAVLHLGMVWLIVGHLVDAALGLRSALHFWTLGLLTLILGIAIRVMRGHGGESLRLGGDGVLLVGLVQLALIGRAVLPLLGVTDSGLIWLGPAALLGAAFALWGVLFGPLVARMSG